jgi:decaprenylphospho-beta-D-erythro-pentofuranosid-2-ulose 2-reductase
LKNVNLPRKQKAFPLSEPSKAPVLILGAKSDLARALAREYAQAGYPLYLAGRKAQQLEADCSDLRIRYGAEATALEFDAADYAGHAAFYAALNPKPELVFCVFGLMTDQEEAEQDWHKARAMLEVNYLGAASILHPIANDFAAQGHGTIVGISSVAGERGRGSNYFYGSAKAGFSALLSGMRNRLSKQGVHVMTVKPGFMATAMTEQLDLPGPLTAQPEAAAQAIVKAVRKKKNVVYVKGLWRYIMLIIRNIPEGIFKKLSL